MFDKPKTYRSEKWLKHVRDIGQCVLCGSTQGIQAAHVNDGKGMGIKTDDCATACLCHECHSEVDNGRDMDKATRKAIMDKAVRITLIKLVRQGKVKPV